MKKKPMKLRLDLEREEGLSRLEYELLNAVFNTRPEELSEDKTIYFDISEIFPGHISDEVFSQIEQAIDLALGITIYEYEEDNEDEHYKFIKIVGSAGYMEDEKIIDLSIGKWASPYMAFVSSEGLKKIEKKTI